MKRRIHLLPNLCTTGNLFCGVLAMVMAMNGQGFVAAWLIFAAMLFDVMDGAVARMQNASSDFGVQYDSMADLVSFGVAPAVMVLEEGLKNTGRLGLTVAFIYCVCTALRLARFNVESARHPAAGSSKGDFVGLPSPAAAGFVAGFIIASYEVNYVPMIIRVLPIMMLGVSWLMVSNVRYPAFNQRLFVERRPFFYFVATVVFLTIVVFQFEFSMLCLFTFYILFGLSGHMNLPGRYRAWKSGLSFSEVWKKSGSFVRRPGSGANQG